MNAVAAARVATVLLAASLVGRDLAGAVLQHVRVQGSDVRAPQERPATAEAIVRGRCLVFQRKERKLVATDRAIPGALVRVLWLQEPGSHKFLRPVPPISTRSGTRIEVRADMLEVVIGAEPGSMVEGVVRDPDGKPVAGARIKCGGRGDHQVLDTLSATDGTYRIGAFSPCRRPGSANRVATRAGA